MATATGYGRRAYRSYVPHPLSGWEPALSAADLSAVTAADRALSATSTLPASALGSTIAEWMMARDESIRSSLIEGVDATESGFAWARYMVQAGKPVSDENDALTLGAAQQIAAAAELGAKMRTGGTCSADDILALHNLLFEGTRERDIGGAVRTSPIWIGPPGCLIEDASFVPPPPEEVPPLLDDLADYVNASGHHPVLKAAVAHAQFETIHPFEDGNGRTGRALIQTVLNASGAADGAVPISTALSNDRQRYYQALNDTRVVCGIGEHAVRSVALSRWLEVLSDSCGEAHRQALSATRSAEMMVSRWRQSKRFRRGSAAAELLEALPAMPVLDADMVSTRLGVAKRAAREALGSLESAGIVHRTGGARNRRFAVPELVDSLRQMGPDGGLARPQFRASDNADGTICGFRGPRSRKDCCLPKGHSGQHRYSAR